MESGPGLSRHGLVDLKNDGVGTFAAPHLGPLPMGEGTRFGNGLIGETELRVSRASQFGREVSEGFSRNDTVEKDAPGS